ncbi:precorrin-6y C5,15-methyltransferase (decarboxylating) subunit CbiE [Sneathiella limimaris]|uniref:precorrin-6y C5,15-methyltransferase (decarboxylating) subunit CbiE n=1 Tax=Sneathiella limimaris TaxID=1964213 RepID=UPI00146C42A6|nr:precorrin-6y C5,15-methyltransferase (decarboxylating) subunit CbiE [Sneathiella limimaris]
MTAWLHIIGVGDDGLDSLPTHLLELINSAELVIGGDRHLAMLPRSFDRPVMSWPSPLIKLVEEVLNRKGKQVVVLATGDPMHYGIGVTFGKHLDKSEFTVHTAPSAFSLAAARLGWDLSKTVNMTLHGRPLELLLPHLFDGAQILALSDDGTTPAKVAKLLTSRGFGDSQMNVLEHMGGPQEACLQGIASLWDQKPTKDLNTIAITLKAGAEALPLSIAPGLPDDAFMQDGQLTKREIRAATLSALTPYPGGLLWDVGAGSGSVGIEWMRLHPQNRAIAIEHRQDRLNMIEVNKTNLGVPGLKIMAGKAPEVLAGLEAPDRIFIGGGLTTSNLFSDCWDALKPGGILVANTVTVEGEQLAFELSDTYGGELTRLNFSRAMKIGGFTSWKPFRQVTQLRLQKI